MFLKLNLIYYIVFFNIFGKPIWHTNKTNVHLIYKTLHSNKYVIEFFLVIL